MSENSEMIQAEGLSKYYGGFPAIDDVSFSIPKGQVVAFLGPNGAGKTTTMKILTGFLSPSKGRALIKGVDVARDPIQTASKIGYLPETGPLYPEMTPMATLKFFGEARGLIGSSLNDRIDKVVNQCRIESVLYKPVSKISHGFRQRVGLAHALLHEPEILILDEPTSGLDPNQIIQVRQMIADLAKTRTILLSTHLLQEVEAMTGRIILIDEGKIKFDGSHGEFLKLGDTLEKAFRELTSVNAEAAEA